MVRHVNECQKIFHNSAHTLEQQFRLVNAIAGRERPHDLCPIEAHLCRALDLFFTCLYVRGSLLVIITVIVIITMVDIIIVIIITIIIIITFSNTVRCVDR